jgi:N-glycosylase/DNA lyase
MHEKANISGEHREELRGMYASQSDALKRKLDEYRAVHPERYFYELCYCLMTPQSSALQCNEVAMELERRRFLEHPFDPMPLLRSWKGGYVRFHNTKAARLLEARAAYPSIAALLTDDMEDRKLRDILAGEIRGIGMKEASHFLRNIGRTRVTIVDRHILRNLLRLGVIAAWPKSISRRRYLEIEAAFEHLAETLGIPADELDLLLWSRETGFLLK